MSETLKGRPPLRSAEQPDPHEDAQGIDVRRLLEQKISGGGPDVQKYERMLQELEQKESQPKPGSPVGLGPTDESRERQAQQEAEEKRTREQQLLQSALTDNNLETAGMYIEKWGLAEREFTSSSELKDHLNASHLFFEDAAGSSPVNAPKYEWQLTVQARLQGKERAVRLTIVGYEGRTSSHFEVTKASVILGPGSTTKT